MKIVNIIAGLSLIIIDLIKQGFLIVVGAITMFFVSNKDNNVFIRLFMYNCWITFGIMIFSVFFIVGQFSVMLGLIAAFIMSFPISTYRDTNYNKYHGGKYDSEYDVVGTFLTLVLIILILILNNMKVAYEYDKLGKFSFTDKELFYEKIIRDTKSHYTDKTKKTAKRYVEMSFKGKRISVNVMGCEVGEHIIFEETLPIKFIPTVKYLYTDYYAECSKEKTNYKEIKE
jgi:hypothetical protein